MRIRYLLGIRLQNFVLKIYYLCVCICLFPDIYNMYTSGTYTATVFGGCCSLPRNFHS